MRYQTLFVSEFLSPTHHSAVVVDCETGLFYNALFGEDHVGGYAYSQMAQTGKPISIEKVRELARSEKAVHAEKFRDITEENWREIIR